jgi:MSHA pilin protein MshD
MQLADERGATLIEVVMAMLVLGVAIPPLLALFREVAAHSASDTYQGVAVTYAESLMEEIVSKAFEDPDLAVGSFGSEESSRAAFDDIDDFDGLNNTPPERFDGSALADYGGFTRSALVESVLSTDPDPITAEADGSTDFKRIRVTVAWTGADGGELTLTTQRTRLAGGGGGGTGPLDEAASAASALRTSSKIFSINLVSISGDDVEVGSFDLSADVATRRVRYFRLAGNAIWSGPASGTYLPTGVIALNAGSAADRTVSAGASPTLEVEFKHVESASPVDYTLILNFTDGSSSTITFTIVW